MIRTNIIELKPNKKQEKILRECMLLSSCVYNSANYIVRQQFFNDEKVSGFFDLRKALQTTSDYQLLGRTYALPRLQIYDETNTSRFRLIQSKVQTDVGLPSYYKNRKTNTTIPSFLVMESYGYHIKKNKVAIPLSNAMRRRYDYKHKQRFMIAYNGVLKHQGRQLRGQIHLKNDKFYLYQAVEIFDQVQKIQSDVVAGLDIGIKNLLTVSTNTNQELIIGSNRFFRQWQYLTNMLTHSPKPDWSIVVKYQSNLFNNIISKMFRFLKRNNVSKLFIGDLTGIRENHNKGKMLNTMTHNYWSFDKLLHKIQNKAEEFGIEIVMTTEEYTSRTCPICFDNSKENCKDRIFECSFCGYIDHRDIIGARNIMLKGMNDLSNRSVHWCEIAPLEI